MADEPQRAFQGAGGTPGGIGEFVIGLVMAAVGGYLILNQVSVTTGFWAFWGYNAFGLTLMPLVVGIGWLFFDGRSAGCWRFSGQRSSWWGSSLISTCIFARPVCSTP